MCAREHAPARRPAPTASTSTSCAPAPPEDLAGARLVCDVRTRTRLWHALPVEVLLRGVRASWRGAGAGAAAATDSAGAAPGADADAVAAAPETIDATDPVGASRGRCARSCGSSPRRAGVARTARRSRPRRRVRRGAASSGRPSSSRCRRSRSTAAAGVNETDAAAAAARVELAAFEVDLRRGALEPRARARAPPACGPLVLRATDDDGRAKRASSTSPRRELRVRTRMDAATFLGALADDHADVATPEARAARPCRAGAPAGAGASAPPPASSSGAARATPAASR